MAHDFDLVDELNKIYVEVKKEDFAPSQILYALVKKGIKDATYIGLACDCEIRFYKVPPFEKCKTFADKIDSSLKKAPSQINNKRWMDEAFELLGYHEHIYTYKGMLDLKERETRIFIDKDNYEYFSRIFKKYEMNPARFLTFLTNVHESNEEIKVNNDGWIININSGEFFSNTDKDTKQTAISHSYSKNERLNYKPIKDFRDKTILESARVTSNEINRVLKRMDRLEPLKDRRARGRFFTHESVSDEISDIVMMIDPDYVIEPFVGTGSLIDPIVESYKGVANDIVGGYIETLRKKYKGSGWKFTSLDTITTEQESLFKKWKIPIGKNVLILTNPPFGTASTNILASKKGEVKKGESRKTKIQYGGLGEKYGRGDLVIPALAKCIEIIKRVGKGYIATFSPAGVMLGRKRYVKLFGAFLKDFKFIEGHIFSGDHFNSVSSKKPIAFTVWRYEPNCHQPLNKIAFYFNGRKYKIKRIMLLKEGWRYGSGSKYVKEQKETSLGVFRCERFNCPNPNIFSINIKEGSGAELSRDNVKIDLTIPNIPSELIYGLWSTCVGHRAIIQPPTHFDNCYTHLPDFSNETTLQILAYALIFNLYSELKINYCKGEIGFEGGLRIFKFGGERLTRSAKYLIDTYSALPIGKKTIKKVFDELKNTPDIKEIDDPRQEIKKEIEMRLEDIGYWDFLPVPEVEKTRDKGIAKIRGVGAKARKILEAEGFDTIQKIAEATIDELACVKGIGEKKAEAFIQSARELRKGDITSFMEKNT